MKTIREIYDEIFSNKQKERESCEFPWRLQGISADGRICWIQFCHKAAERSCHQRRVLGTCTALLL